MNTMTLSGARAERGGIIPVRISPREMLDLVPDRLDFLDDERTLQVGDLKRDGRIFLLDDRAEYDLLPGRAEKLFRRGDLSGPYERWALLQTFPDGRGMPLNLLVVVVHKGSACSFVVLRSYRFGDGGTALVPLCEVNFSCAENSGELDVRCVPYNPDTHEENVSAFVETVLSDMFRIADCRVPLERITADAKLNVARVKRGKSPIPPYWKVGVPYVTELSNTRSNGTSIRTSGDTHASPVPHARRAHPRRLPSGRVVWVRDCKIGEIVRHLTRKREFYALASGNGSTS